MSKVKLVILAKLDIIPPSASKLKIENDLKKFLLEINPDLKFEIETGHGSWWIFIGTWIGNEFASWLASKGFDTIVKKLKSPNNMSEENDLPPLDSDNLNLVESNKDTSQTSEIARMLTLMEDLHKTIDQGGKTKITLGFIDNENNGIVSSYERESNDIDFKVIRTNTQNQFDSLTKP